MFPVTCVPAPARQWRRVASVLGELDLTPPPPVELAARLQGLSLFNGEVYAMDRLFARPDLRLDCRLGSYFASMNTCESIELELLEQLPALAGRAPADFARFDRRLERRNAVGPLTPAIGVATLTVCGDEILLGRLAPKAMPHRAGQWHVVPSGMFAPPYSIEDTVSVELREELGVELDPSRLYFSGVATNLLNLRPEICTLLVLDKPEEFLLSDEFLPGLTRIPLATETELIQTLGLHAGNISPAGAAALFLGLRLLRRLRP
ncbi:NUDIX hydrolase [Paludibaculum fermentans]|uniref:Nudix hydrolase domain-containing protein n=1 Tax=Paludibaculum fermentans TaxID=1473598 RepID=A0A7S7SL68_PALFE|nr:hypothetical protein [Paludibaculum fermentans]QOY89079.1 hypothetical protein IRI77_03725 [Paludibaculum fermentans]